MRSFNENEKGILRRVCEVQPTELVTISRFISDNVFTEDSGMALIFIPEKEVAILYLKGTKENPENRKRMIQFLELISLIDYLIIERYLHYVHFSITAKFAIMGEGFDEIHQTENLDIVLNRSGTHIKPSDVGWIYDSGGNRCYEGLMFKKSESSMYEAIENFAASPLVPSQELIDFVRNNYKTIEDLRYESASRYTKIALGVAIFFGVLSTIFGIASVF